MVVSREGGSTILYYGDDRLRRPCRVVRDDEEVDQLAQALWQILSAARGVGLAAPQLGDLRRVIVLKDPRRNRHPRRLVLINPEILDYSSEESSFEEGCLSFPGIYLNIVRPSTIHLLFRDLAGTRHEMNADGLLSRIIQHEMDHLDGVLFIDHLSPVRRWLMSWRLRRLTGRAQEDVA